MNPGKRTKGNWNRTMATLKKLGTLGAAMTVLTIGAAPLLTNAADHLDAPALGGTVVAGDIAPHSEHGDRDLNDLYVFEAPNDPGRTAIAITTNPAINLFGGDFGTNVRYVINIDTTGDNVQDVAYVATFTKHGKSELKFTVALYEGRSAITLRCGDKERDDDSRGDRRDSRSSDGQACGRIIATGRTNQAAKSIGSNDVWAWAGVRSDPFFFDLTGFIGTTTLLTTGTAVGGDGLGNNPTDFFANLNTNAIVLSVPNSAFPDRIGVWASTSYRTWSGWHKADQIGRPAINTVFNPTADKDAFNRTKPSRQLTAYGGKFYSNVVNGLLFLSSLDSEGAYTQGQAEALASILIPDVLVYDRTSALPAPLNGRALADDVIDVELRVATGGDPLGLFPGRDANGAVNGDGVGPHSDYLAAFPYLGVPH